MAYEVSDLIKIKEYKRPNVRGGIVIDGFPSSSLVTPLVASYLVAHLNMDQVAFIESAHFPPVAFIYGGKPRYPARVYVEEELKLVAFVSEFNLPLWLSRSVANKIIDWSLRNGCEMVISTLSIPKESGDAKIYGIGSTGRAREMLSNAGIEQLSVGVVPGVPGVLLCEGRWNNFDVVVLLAEVTEYTPLFAAAAMLLEALTRLVPRIKIDLEPLYKEAKAMQDRLQSLREVAQAAERKPMYA
ncbi:MAG: PAC2 family protein [Nitrososphaerota archaeon]|nr:PAC2 family protein [Aigarchaeota archaeon]MDW8076694.1 PAC2 family protein [Nitrososphaerota archaeon]